MNKKELIIALGFLAVAGISYYIYNESKFKKCSKLCDEFCGCVGCGKCEKSGGCSCNKIKI